ncbi:hypothetical protein BGM26_06530 [Bacillus sp. FJAT-29790]|uniref:hypothetical protein n=1 Tax=Bacillus sp. FJAT-29790 TaxID=1895002 RepID=UPI001C2275B4|nr:hypothetical protein [Bacillus sp. FJAT-29790]MBU8878644.1 hypothetical protein [Bacillus sp. FJAT-29790]
MKMRVNNKKNKPAPNVSGTYQVASEEQKISLDEMLKNGELDQESMYYARVFMEE